MGDDKLSRQDVDSLSTQILINLGLLNGAALAASFADLAELNATPFAIGLVSAIFAQVWWYVDAALEYTFQEHEIQSTTLEQFLEFIVMFCILGGGAVSGACVVIGCFMIMGFSGLASLIWSIGLCIVPFITLFWIGFSRLKKL